MIKEIKNRIKTMPIVDGKLVWGSCGVYKMLMWMVENHADEREGNTLIVQQEGATATISE